MPTGRDASVFGDDCVELFLQPPGQPYLHFAANSANGTYEGRGTDKSWNCEWQCVARRSRTSYMIEMAIPFAALGGKPTGDWRWNVTRHRPQAKEYSTWSGLQGAFHQPELFGALRFAADGPGCSPMSIGQTETGEKLNVTIAGKATVEVDLGVRRRNDHRTAHRDGRHRVEHPRSAGRPGRRRLPGSLPAAGGRIGVAESAPIIRVLSAGVARLELVVVDASVTVILNGRSVVVDAREKAELDLVLQGGMNTIRFAATVRGDNPSILPTVYQGASPLPLRWRIAKASPSADWELAPLRAFWSGKGEPRCFAGATILVAQSTPPLFPKTDRFLVPQGSAQLLRPYLPMAPELLLPDYRLVVEAPARLALHRPGALRGARTGGRAHRGRRRAAPSRPLLRRHPRRRPRALPLLGRCQQGPRSPTSPRSPPAAPTTGPA